LHASAHGAVTASHDFAPKSAHRDTLHDPPMHTLSPVRGFSAQLSFTHPHSVTRFGFGVPTGHVATTPLHLDAEAQLFSLSQILFADADTTWHCDADPSSAVQHGKRRAFWGEHVYPAFVLTVQLDVQHDLFVHANPQSQSSP